MYLKTKEEAKKLGELGLWHENRRENQACAELMKNTIARCFDGLHLSDECVGEVISVYGFKRTLWVLAATVRYKSYDGRFSRTTKEWAESVIPADYPKDELIGMTCDAHPALLEGYIRMLREQEPELQAEMEEMSQC